MSKRLDRIETSCKYFDIAIEYIKNINDIIENEDFDKDYAKQIKENLDSIYENIEDARTINGELRDTCSDIAEEKNKEIEKLNDEIYELEELLSDYNKD